MKKTLALLLAVATVLSLGVCAFAVDSPSGGGGGGYVPERTSTLPAVVNSNGVKLTEFNDKVKLSDAAEAEFKEAKASVGTAAPAGMTSRYLFYAESTSYPVDVTISVTNVNDVAVKLYSNSSWSDLKVSANGSDYTFTLTGAGAVAVYTK